MQNSFCMLFSEEATHNDRKRKMAKRSNNKTEYRYRVGMVPVLQSLIYY